MRRQRNPFFLSVTVLALAPMPALFAAPSHDEAPWLRVESVVTPDPALRVDPAAIRALLAAAPRERTAAATRPVVVPLPLADGRIVPFLAIESPQMDDALAAARPEVRDYAVRARDEPGTTGRIHVDATGVRAFLLDGSGEMTLVEPTPGGGPNDYRAIRSGRAAPAPTACGTTNASAPGGDATAGASEPEISFDYAGTLRTYRFVGAATAEFTAQNGGVTGARAAISSNVAAINSIYERDFSVRLIEINNASVVFTDPATDGYTTGSVSALTAENQGILDARIGSANYDIGVVYDAAAADGSAAGQGTISSVCVAGQKGRGTTGGTSIGLAAHEFGHMFGARHTFNDITFGACANPGQHDPSSSYEPESGTTLMSYAGTCGLSNVDSSRGLYFHVHNIDQVRQYVTAGNGAGCANAIATGNVAPVIALVTANNFTIPQLTPFRLAANATDANGDAVTITWEEHDRGTPGPSDTDDGERPRFRSRPGPTLASDPFARMFPQLPWILETSNNPPLSVPCPSNPTQSCKTGERLPLRDRIMGFQATARDQHSDANGINGGISTRGVFVTVHADAGPFLVTTPPDFAATWYPGEQRLVTWDVAGTNLPPINATNVRIKLSLDGGQTFPVTLAGPTPNDGSQLITVPVTPTSQARIKVEVVDNVFFDIYDSNYTIAPLTVTTDADDGAGSLRRAIVAANGVDGPVTLRFAIPGAGTHRIVLASPLPEVTKPLTIDGLSQGGASYFGPPLVELSGEALAPNVDGLVLAGGNASVSGLAIGRFPRHGIVLKTAGGNLLHSLHIGVAADGNTAFGNGGAGILIDNVPDNRIGEASILGEERRSIIAANDTGVLIRGAAARNNRLYLNTIGLAANGTDLGNRFDGVLIDGGVDNEIGGTYTVGSDTIRAGNVISGNGDINFGADGIEVRGAGASGNVIRGNWIGLAPDGTTARGNLGNGVLVAGAPGTLVGGSGPGEGNVIAASGNQGGIALVGTGASGTTIYGNRIGTTADGMAARPNNATGIDVQSANNVIGGVAPGMRNQIVGPTGIYFEFAPGPNTVRNNVIGANATGDAPLNVTGTGIELRGATNVTIGGSAPDQGNLISGNFTAISLAGATSGVVIAGNTIGTNAAGTAALGGTRGIIGSAANVTIGGDVAGAGNLISGLGSGGNDHAISLSDCVTCRVQGNSIGTNRARTAIVANGGGGVFVFGGGSSVTIGGTTALAGNVIGGNLSGGVLISASNTIVRGNLIGTNAAGDDLGNGGSVASGTIEIGSGSGNVIGGTAPGEANVIAFGGGPAAQGGAGSGLRIFSAGNTVRGNAIYGSTELGIDLPGGTEIGATRVTVNDPCDADTGANDLQNYPVLASVGAGGGGTAIAGTLDSVANAAFTIDFYATVGCDGSGYGEGARYLGSTQVTTNASCAASFNATVPTALTAGEVVTATATAANGSTSEFSACAAGSVAELIFRDSFE